MGILIQSGVILRTGCKRFVGVSRCIKKSVMRREGLLLMRLCILSRCGGLGRIILHKMGSLLQSTLDTEWNLPSPVSSRINQKISKTSRKISQNTTNQCQRMLRFQKRIPIKKTQMRPMGNEENDINDLIITFNKEIFIIIYNRFPS